MASQSTELITALRENLRQTLISSHILSSVAKLQEYLSQLIAYIRIFFFYLLQISTTQAFAARLCTIWRHCSQGDSIKGITFEPIACHIKIELTLIQSAWTISLAEQAGFIYLDPVKAEPGTKRPADSATLFRVIFPLLFYGYFVNAVQPGDLLSIEYVTGCIICAN